MKKNYIIYALLIFGGFLCMADVDTSYLLYIPGEKSLDIVQDLAEQGFGHLDEIKKHVSFLYDVDKKPKAIKFDTTDGNNDFFTYPVPAQTRRVTIIFKARGAKDADTGTPYGMFWAGWQRGEYQSLLRHNHSNQIKGPIGQTNLKPDDIVSDWHEFRLVFEVAPDNKSMTAKAYIDNKLRHITEQYVKQNAEWSGVGNFIAFGDYDGSTNGFARYLYLLFIFDEDVSELSLSQLSKRVGFDLTTIPTLINDNNPPSKRPAFKPKGITMLAQEVNKDASWLDPAALQNNEIDLDRLPYSKNKALVIQKNPSSFDLKKIGSYITVSSDGSPGTYKTIAEAIDVAKPGTAIFIRKGLYREKLKITKPDITLIGESPANTIIYGYEADMGGIDGNILVEVSLQGEAFNACNLTFYNKGAEWNKTWGKAERRSVAFAIRNVGKGFVRNCVFLGQQDTLYLRSGRLYMENCYIEGEVDFICGGATVFFQNCQIHSIYYPHGGYITAAAPSDSGGLGFDNGYVFNNCRFTADPALEQAKPVYLGRGAWQNGSNGKGSAKVVIQNSIISKLSGKAGWTDWDTESTAERQFFREYNNTGEGAIQGENPGRKVLTDQEYKTLYAQPELVLGYTPKFPW
jgi:pectinesterase